MITVKAPKFVPGNKIINDKTGEIVEVLCVKFFNINKGIWDYKTTGNNISSEEINNWILLADAVDSRGNIELDIICKNEE
jgi:hypothetical protein